ncbi:MAG: acyl carrier protein [Planctomycetes bacterium]|nr:acyl carrier protein [Planctomycetota bacterium]
MNTFYRLQSIFRDVFSNPQLVLSEDMAMSNFAEWDSVAMVHIILAAEAEFGVRFNMDEVAAASSVADILKMIDAYLTEL